MTITTTKRKILKAIGNGLAYREEFDNLPGGDDTSYTPSEMAKLGVEHNTIAWAFLRPEVLGADFVGTVCRLADGVLQVFELARPDDTRPRAAIEAARVCFANPSAENKAAAWAAVRATDDAICAVVAAGASWAALRATEAVREASAAAAWLAKGVQKLAADDAGRAAASVFEAGCPRAEIIRIIEGQGE